VTETGDPGVGATAGGWLELTAFQMEVARLFFALPESAGFLLAGGAALVAQHLTTRPTEDLDFFTTPETGHVPRTKTEVKAKLRDLRRDLDNGVRPNATYTVGAALDDWLANRLSGRSDRTRELYTDTVKPLREQLGEVELKELSAGDVQETLDALAARLGPPQTRRHRKAGACCCCRGWLPRHSGNISTARMRTAC
jgi:nucleotidyltransferase AbiEii toxin of type IV toxin-antitoxin system